MEDQIAELFLRLAKIFNDQLTIKFLEFRDDMPAEKLLVQLTKFVEKLEERNKVKLFEFNDKTHRNILVKYILDFRGEMTIDYEPSILINDFPDKLKEKENPVWRMELVYDTIEARDEDLEKLVFLKK